MKAFPNPHRTDETGMTLRDYFAAKAMPGMMASGNLPKSVKDDELSAAAYQIADAMLKARQAKGEERVKQPTQADYEAGRILHEAWYNVGRATAPPFDLIDKFDRLRWIETAKVSNAAQPVQPVQEPLTEAYAFVDLIRADERREILKLADSLGWVSVDDIRARGNK